MYKRFYESPDGDLWIHKTRYNDSNKSRQFYSFLLYDCDWLVVTVIAEAGS